MTLELHLTPAAEADLDSIWDYTAARWSERQAQHYFDELDGAFLLLCDFPGIGPLRPDLSPRARLHPFRSHVILYTDDTDRLTVLRVLHARADWLALLGGA